MANTPKKKSSRAKATKSAAENLDAARRASKSAATAAASQDSNEAATNPFQPPFGMPMPPFPMGQHGTAMGGPNPMMPPIPPGALPSPTATGDLLGSVGTMIKLGIDAINTALAGSNQLLQGMSGRGYYPYAHHHHGCGCHPHGHHCCQHNHYHDSYGHSCCDHYGESCCYSSVHNCCK